MIIVITTNCMVDPLHTRIDYSWLIYYYQYKDIFQKVAWVSEASDFREQVEIFPRTASSLWVMTE